MKRNCLILTVVVSSILLLQIGCQKQTDLAEEPKTTVVEPKLVAPPPTPPEKPQITEPEPPKNAPKITFEKVIHDFGQVGPGTRNVCEFKFTNAGNALLKIKKIQSTCGCTVASLSKKEYAPGESGTITATYSVGRMPGTQSKHLYALSNDNASPKVTLTIKAEVVLKVTHKPEKLNLLLKDENAGCPKITLTSIDGQPFAIKSFKAPQNCITAAFDSSVKATKFVLEPKVDIEKLKKNLRGYIRIGLTHPECDTLTISFNALPRFKITPYSIMVRNAEPQKPIKRVVWILNNYGEDFEIDSASSKNDTIKVLSREKVDNRYKLELEITPPAGDKRVFTDVLYVNIKGGEKLEINCHGFYAMNKKSS